MDDCLLWQSECCLWCQRGNLQLACSQHRADAGRTRLAADFPERRPPAGSNHLAQNAVVKNLARDVPVLEPAAGGDVSSADDDQLHFLEQFRISAVRSGDDGFNLCRRQRGGLLSRDAVAPVKNYMPQVMKTILLTVIAVFGLMPSSRAYSLAGPVGNGGDAWQVPADGFGPPVDVVAPKNIGEEYRRNVPVVYYACDANFLGFFGSNGKQAIDNAFAVLNRVFTNNATGRTTGLDGYSQSLSEFPLNSRHVNYQAQVLGLFDLKSYTIGLMMEQLGLADPTLYVWGIHDWYHTTPGPPCPAGQNYLVVQRNFDIISSPLNQLQYSPYINNVLYSYSILENCTGPNPVREAVPFSADPLADSYTPVTAFSIAWGEYYTGLTRDDVAGLRYLLQGNNINWETVSADSLQYVITTNAAAPIVFPPYIFGATNFVSGANAGYYTFTGAANGGYGYGDLAAFLAFITTNNPAAVQAAYPGVVINTGSNTVTIVSNVTHRS